jgi:Protein of unknown function (DUF2946)
MDEIELLSSTAFSIQAVHVSKIGMRGNYRRIFLNIFIMLAVIGAGISPACKFISGQQTWLEICGAEGIKKVLIASDEVPDGGHQKHADAEPCAFCLTHANVKVITTKVADVPLPVLKAERNNFTEQKTIIAALYDHAAFPRGPPTTL